MTPDEIRAHAIGVKLDTTGLPAKMVLLPSRRHAEAFSERIRPRAAAGSNDTAAVDGQVKQWMENFEAQFRRAEEESQRADRAETILDRIAWDDRGRAILRHATSRSINPTTAGLIFIGALVIGVMFGVTIHSAIRSFQ